MKRKGFILCLLLALAMTASMASTAAAQPEQKNIIMATTTSTQDSGLLDFLLPIFEKKTGYFVKT
ncbi:MAG: ABC-type tungstate transport system, solute-binding protein, partial [Deltaproteobacteria bacterium]|nr:ABC-type tungstate transport system, solute-binding protein [Deltaproteobacteria bacterium]